MQFFCCSFWIAAGAYSLTGDYYAEAHSCPLIPTIVHAPANNAKATFGFTRYLPAMGLMGHLGPAEGRAAGIGRKK
jgi:hypothetical protein